MTGGLPSMPKGLAHSWRNLSALVDATHERQPIPCRSDEGVPSLWWTSDNNSEQAAAAAACGPCPLVAPCKQYGIEHPTEGGAYGGLTERQRSKAARAKTKREADEP